MLEGELDYQEDKALLELKNNRLKISDLTLPVHGSMSNLATTPKVNLDYQQRQFGRQADLPCAFRVRFRSPRHGNLWAHGADMTLSAIQRSDHRVRGVLKNVYVKGKRALKGNLTGECPPPSTARRRPG